MNNYYVSLNVLSLRGMPERRGQTGASALYSGKAATELHWRELSLIRLAAALASAHWSSFPVFFFLLFFSFFLFFFLFWEKLVDSLDNVCKYSGGGGPSFAATRVNRFSFFSLFLNTPTGVRTHARTRLSTRNALENTRARAHLLKRGITRCLARKRYHQRAHTRDYKHALSQTSTLSAIRGSLSFQIPLSFFLHLRR